MAILWVASVIKELPLQVFRKGRAKDFENDKMRGTNTTEEWKGILPPLSLVTTGALTACRGERLNLGLELRKGRRRGLGDFREGSSPPTGYKNCWLRK